MSPSRRGNIRVLIRDDFIFTQSQENSFELGLGFYSIRKKKHGAPIIAQSETGMSKCKPWTPILLDCSVGMVNIFFFSETDFVL